MKSLPLTPWALDINLGIASSTPLSLHASGVNFWLSITNWVPDSNPSRTNKKFFESATPAKEIIYKGFCRLTDVYHSTLIGLSITCYRSHDDGSRDEGRDGSYDQSHHLSGYRHQNEFRKTYNNPPYRLLFRNRNAVYYNLSMKTKIQIYILSNFSALKVMSCFIRLRRSSDGSMGEKNVSDGRKTHFFGIGERDICLWKWVWEYLYR